jgi:ribosomal protein S18 acetylase RimI-like enzyme
MDRQAVLRAFNEQIRRGEIEPDASIERAGRVVRYVGGDDGWNGVLWSDLDPGNADEVIAEQVRRFADVTEPWEWKHFSYDQPLDLPDRLVAAGFVREAEETMLVAEIADLDLDVPPPDGVELRPVNDAGDVEALVAVHDEVFGGDHASTGRAILTGLAHEPPTVAAVVAWAGDTPVSAARVEFYLGTDFASIWGGGTLPDWRGRGVFRSLVAYRAALAAKRGYRYLQVDASDDSRPILGRLGFVELATTTPFMHPGTGAGTTKSH